METKDINQRVFDMFTRNAEGVWKDAGYEADRKKQERIAWNRAHDEMVIMYLNDPKEYKAFMSSIDEGTATYKGALAGKDTALEIMKAQNHAYHAEKLYKEALNISHKLRIVDPEAHKNMGDYMAKRGGPALEGFKAGTHKAERDLKYGIYKQGSYKAVEKNKDKGNDKGIDMDD